MTKAGEQLIEGATEALAVARGEQPAARLHIAGHAYVPEARWQPIESAPKDGTRIDVWVDRGREPGYRETNAQWDEEDGGWVKRTRSYSFPIEGMIDNATGVPRIRVTHWMPLPAPPTPSPQSEP